MARKTATAEPEEQEIPAVLRGVVRPRTQTPPTKPAGRTAPVTPEQEKVRARIEAHKAGRPRPADLPETVTRRGAGSAGGRSVTTAAANGTPRRRRAEPEPEPARRTQKQTVPAAPPRRGKQTEPAPAEAPSKGSLRDAKQDLARRVVDAIGKVLAGARGSELFLTAMSRDEAAQVASNWVHHLPTGSDAGKRYWPQDLPRPERSDWR